MTKREAEKRVWAALRATLENDRTHAGWPICDNDADQDCMDAAIERVLNQLDRKAGDD